MIKKIFISLLIAVTFFSCDNASDKTQGIIEYEITYPKIEHDHFMMDFLPTKMVLKFKDDRYLTEISAGMGMFKTHYFVDESNNEFSQYLKIFNKKFVLTYRGDEITRANEALPPIKIKKTFNTKTILGYKCKEAIVEIEKENDFDRFTVYYTDSIKINNPNWWNQFNELNGTLMEYQYERYDICMHLKAKKIKFKKIDDDEFDLGDDYVAVDQERMDKEMEEVFSSFKD